MTLQVVFTLINIHWLLIPGAEDFFEKSIGYLSDGIYHLIESEGNGIWPPHQCRISLLHAVLLLYILEYDIQFQQQRLRFPKLTSKIDIARLRRVQPEFKEVFCSASKFLTIRRRTIDSFGCVQISQAARDTCVNWFMYQSRLFCSGLNKID